MSIHDTYVTLKPEFPFQDIEHFFPEGLPMRDPFPMEFSQTPDGQPVALWVVDLHRLNNEQIKAFASLMAARHDVSIETILEDCEKRSGFFVNDTWVNSMSGGAENYRRTLELLDRRIDLEQINLEELNDFYAQQYRDWIEGDRVPESMPENYEDIDPRLKSPKLEKAYKQIAIHKFLNDGNYSVFDVLIGKATVDALNHIDPDADWELATDYP